MSTESLAASRRSIFLHAFRREDSQEFDRLFDEKLNAEKNGEPGPTVEECLLYTGHVGISFDEDPEIYGFKPKLGEMPFWKMLDELKDWVAFDGVVSDDSTVFQEASRRDLEVYKIQFIVSESDFKRIHKEFLQELKSSQFTYSFPGGEGHCNCATWPGRLGILLPEETGIMKFYVEAMSKMETPQQLS